MFKGGPRDPLPHKPVPQKAGGPLFWRPGCWLFSPLVGGLGRNVTLLWGSWGLRSSPKIGNSGVLVEILQDRGGTWQMFYGPPWGVGRGSTDPRGRYRRPGALVSKTKRSGLKYTSPRARLLTSLNPPALSSPRLFFPFLLFHLCFLRLIFHAGGEILDFLIPPSLCERG